MKPKFAIQQGYFSVNKIPFINVLWPLYLDILICMHLPLVAVHTFLGMCTSFLISIENLAQNQLFSGLSSFTHMANPWKNKHFKCSLEK